MHYKSILLQLLEQHPEISEPLRKSRTMLAAVNHYSTIVKNRHTAWQKKLAEARPESAPSQIASEALEIALAEMQARLSSASSPSANDPLSLDAAMAFLKGPMPSA